MEACMRSGVNTLSGAGYEGISQEPALRELARWAHIWKVMRLLRLGTADEPPGAQFAFAHRQSSRCVVGCVFVSFARFDGAMPVLDGRRAGPGDIIAQADFRNGVQGWTVDGTVSSKVFQCDVDRHLRVMLRWPAALDRPRHARGRRRRPSRLVSQRCMRSKTANLSSGVYSLRPTALQVLCIV